MIICLVIESKKLDSKPVALHFNFDEGIRPFCSDTRYILPRRAVELLFTPNLNSTGRISGRVIKRPIAARIDYLCHSSNNTDGEFRKCHSERALWTSNLYLESETTFHSQRSYLLVFFCSNTILPLKLHSQVYHISKPSISTDGNMIIAEGQLQYLAVCNIVEILSTSGW